MPDSDAFGKLLRDVAIRSGALTRGTQQRPVGFMQAAVDRSYLRRGPRVVFLAYGWCVVFALLVAYLSLASVTRYLDLNVSDIAPNVTVLVLSAGPVAALTLWLSRDLFRTPLSWVGEKRTREQAPVVWASLVRLPYMIAARTATVAIVLMVPFTALVLTAAGEHEWYSTIPFYACAIATLMVCGVLWTFGIEFALRPMLRDVAAYLPADFEPTTHAWRLQTKALLPLPMVTLLSGLTTGAFVDLASPGTLRLAIAIAIAAATALAACSLFLMIARATLDPIDDLIAATHRVRAGDVATTVPVVTSDELGRLASSFNAMLADLRSSRARVVTAADVARRRVERDLHDGAQQRLVLLQLKLGLTVGALRQDPVAAERLVQEMRSDLDLALAELRDLARGLYPAVLENAGLSEALAEALTRSPIPATLQCDDLGQLPSELQAAAYFCCVEALQNAAKHAGTDASATVTLAQREGTLVFVVADDGAGFDPTHVTPGGGLQNINDRIGALGGQLHIDSTPAAGTTVTGRLPTHN